MYAHLSLIVIFTISEAVATAGTKERTVPIVIFTIGRRFVMMMSTCAHLSLMVIFTIGQAGDTYIQDARVLGSYKHG